MNYFVVMLPEKAELPRSENFKYMVESFNQLAPTLEGSSGKIVIEVGRDRARFAARPKATALFFKECPSPAMGVNYDPSHLLRMGIDPLRFLREVVDRVYHVHGKDTELFPEALYLYGTEQPPTLGKPHGFGNMHWRYTIPGHGIVPWTEIFRILVGAGYKGAVSVELEDENFNGSQEGQKEGLIHGRNFLQSA